MGNLKQQGIENIFEYERVSLINSTRDRFNS